jgi:hypothetical protein
VPEHYVKVTLEKPSLSFISTWLGVVKGAQRQYDTLTMAEVSSAGEPRFADTANLATSSKHCEIGGTKRAVFGEHGFVSKTLLRCFELIKRMMAIIERFLEVSGAAPLEHVEKVLRVIAPFQA